MSALKTIQTKIFQMIGWQLNFIPSSQEACSSFFFNLIFIKKANVELWKSWYKGLNIFSSDSRLSKHGIHRPERWTVPDRRTIKRTKELVKINVLAVHLPLDTWGNLCGWSPWRKPGSDSTADGLIHDAHVNPQRQPWKCKQVANDRVQPLWAAPALAVRYSDVMLQGSSWWVSGLGKHFPLRITPHSRGGTPQGRGDLDYFRWREERGGGLTSLAHNLVWRLLTSG